jgi:quinoprotein glucose dehydrogenase
MAVSCRCWCVVAAAMLASLITAARGVAQDAAEPTHDPDGITVPEGFEWDEWAREPLVPDPVALTVLPDGSVFVCESERQDRGVEDNRYSPYWLLEDLAATTVDDRLAIYQRWSAKKEGGMDWYTRWADRVRRLRDADGDGRADRSTNFSGDLREVLDGTAAGVLQVGDSIWVTSIPDVWRFRDVDGDGVADERERLFSGFGVRTSLRGHDMHGLVQGPDGRIWWSIGDRGFSVRTREGQVLSDPGTGAVFRCEPDGSGLEVWARGLRNPQELAFNDLGDLFTVDNNSDAGDKARVVHLPDGGETGWEMPYQTLEGDNKRGPWSQEHLWHEFDAADPLQAAWITPPVAHLTSGPSGLAAYPGTGFPPEFDGTFLICDFLGGDAYSQVWRFGVEPRGAGYALVDPQVFIRNVLPTDVEFAPDGKLYVSDWWNGWQSDGKGRIYRVWHPRQGVRPEAVQVWRVLQEGFADRPVAELAELLDHPDRRLRQGAHLQLAGMGAEGVQALIAVAADAAASARARRHAVWGLQVLARTSAGSSSANAACAALAQLCTSDDAEIRAQAVRALGDSGWSGAAEVVRPLLLDASTRVRSLAAAAAGRLRDGGAMNELTAVLWENEDADPWLRHAAATALARIGDRARLQALAADQFPQVRLGAVLALRWLRDPAVERLLFDPEPSVALEAARAVYDQPIPEAMPALAAMGDRFLASASAAEVGGFVPEDPRTLPLLRRVIAANRHGADPACAARLADLAGSARVPSTARLLAMETLAEWPAPEPREPVHGRVGMPIDTDRSAEGWKRVLATRLPALVTQAPDESVRTKARALAAAVGVPLDPDAALHTALDADADVGERLACLQQLTRSGGEPLVQALAATLQASDPQLRAASLGVLATVDPDAALERVRALLSTEAITRHPLPETQSAVAVLGQLSRPESDALLEGLAGQARDGTLPPGLMLDVIQAAESRSGTAAQRLVTTWRERKASADSLQPFLPSLEGGDAERGRRIVTGHVGAQCLRCHSLAGGGGHAGPSLEGVAKRHDRRGLLESLVLPNARIAEGFGPTSAMPSMNTLLTPAELRDVTAYLAGLK